MKKKLAQSTIFLASALLAHASVAPTQLRCEYAVDPLGVDVAAPRLFWVLDSNERGQRQTRGPGDGADQERSPQPHGCKDSGKLARLCLRP